MRPAGLAEVHAICVSFSFLREGANSGSMLKEDCGGEEELKF